jgi:hypothetical protein
VDANSDQDMTIVHSSLPKMRTKVYTFSTTHHLCSLPPVQMPALKLPAKNAHQKSRLSLQDTLKCLDSLAALSLYAFCLYFCHTFSMLLQHWSIVQKPALKLSTENANQSVHFLYSVRSLSLLSGLHSLPSEDMSTTKPKF